MSDSESGAASAGAAANRDTVIGTSQAASDSDGHGPLIFSQNLVGFFPKSKVTPIIPEM